jgi:hypothetical protein
MEEKRSTVSRVIQCFCFEEKRGKTSAHFSREKEHARRILVLTQRCVAAASSRSRAASGLT